MNNRYGIWPSKTHAVIDLSISTIMLAVVARQIWKDRQEMKDWAKKAENLRPEFRVTSIEI